MVISEKYAYEAWLSYLIEKNNNHTVIEIFIYYEPQVRAMERILKRNNVVYKKSNQSFYL